VTSQQKIRTVLLIDADNVGAFEAIATILKQLQTHHHFIIKRAYGDWFAPQLKNWKDFLFQQEIEPIHSLPTASNGKNATDICLTIHAMDLLQTPDTQAFCIVSGDRDFAPLVRRLKQADKQLIGVGRQNTPKILREAFTEFHTFPEVKKSKSSQSASAESKANTTESKTNTNSQKTSAKSGQTHLTLVNGAKASQTKADTQKPFSNELKQILQSAFLQFQPQDGWLTLGQIESKLREQCQQVLKQNFSCKLFGCKTMVEVINQTGLFEFDAQQDKKTNSKERRIRLRQAA